MEAGRLGVENYPLLSLVCANLRLQEPMFQEIKQKKKTGKMAQPFKHEDLNSIPQKPYRKAGQGSMWWFE